MGLLAGKTAIVTGAASGIGKSIVDRFASEGAHVVCIDKDQAVMSDIAEPASGGKMTWQQADITDARAITKFIRSQNQIDILVNNAAVSSIGTLETTTVGELDRVLEVNVKGAFYVSKATLPLLKQSRSGVILNIASIAAKVGLKERFAYSVSKGAVLSMTLSVARDLVDYGVRCNCICPSRVHTPFIDGYLAHYPPEKRKQELKELSAFQPIKRMGLPGEVASLAAFLCSEEANFITGTAFDIDGGVLGLR